MKDLDDSEKTSLQKSANLIFLVGFMGSGKTYWGSRWASISNLAFVDLDEIIEANEKNSIAEIFETRGEDHFRTIEAIALRKCAGMYDTIVACGGGTPCFFNNMDWMNEHGTTVYISGTAGEILPRILSEQEKRPLLKKMDRQELLSFIEQKIIERAPFYNRAMIIAQSVELNETSISAIVSTTNA